MFKGRHFPGKVLGTLGGATLRRKILQASGGSGNFNDYEKSDHPKMGRQAPTHSQPDYESTNLIVSNQAHKAV